MMNKYMHIIKLLSATAIFLFTQNLLLAQVNQINGNEVYVDSLLPGENSYVITARDHILLQPGFSYSASQGGSLHGEIDPWYMEPVDINNTTGGPVGDIGQLVGTEGVVGSIPGAFAASPSGAATYTIPIECPPGINGMTPNLSLVYNSQAGNGIAGWGWNLSGISAISRIPKTVYYDNEAREIKWDNTDVFALDGQRLLVKSIFTDSIEYRLENDPKPKIMAYGCNQFGPGWFKVWDGSGNIYYYQTKNYLKKSEIDLIMEDECSSQTINTHTEENYLISYNLTRKEDIHNNYVQFFYTNDSIVEGVNEFTYEYYYEDDPSNPCVITYNTDGENKYLTNHRVSEINYGNGENPIYSILFDYADRLDTIKGYLSGVLYSNSKLLSSISVRYGSASGSELSKYNLIYTTLEYAYLQSVELSGMEGESYNKTVFEWEESEYNITKSDSYNFHYPSSHDSWLSNGYERIRSVYYADFNGDGVTDFFVKFWFKKGAASHYRWAVYINNGVPAYLYPKGEGSFPPSQDFYFIDTDMDGRDELYLKHRHFFSPNWNVRFMRHEYCPVSDTIVYNWEDDIYIPFYSVDYRDNDLLHLVAADFEGKGYPSFLLLKNENNIYSFENTGNFQGQCIATGFGQPKKYHLIDFNGNGKTDILFLYDNSFAVWEYCKTLGKFKNIYTQSTIFNRYDIVLPGDFNGDGNSDILYKKNNGNWNIVISNGKSYLHNTILPPGLSTSYSPSIADYTVYDINLDGKDDIMEISRIYQGGQIINKLRIYVQEGSGFTLKKEENRYGCLRYTGYANNDITKDVFANPGMGLPYYYSVSQGKYFNTIKKVFDGKGNVFDLEYGITTSKNGNQVVQYDDNDLTVFTSKTFIRTIRSIENGPFKTEYAFGEPLIHTHGKGFLGFGQTITQSFAGGQETGSSIQLSRLIEKGSASKYELLPDTLIQKLNNTQVSLTTMSYNTKIINNQHYLVTDSIVNKDFIHNTRNVQTFSNYNDYLLPVKTYTRYYQDANELIAVDSVSAQYMNILSGDTRIFGLPESITSFKKRPGETDYIRKSDFEYYTNGMLKKRYEEKNTAKEIKTEYSYDTFGNTLSVTTSAPGEAGTPSQEKVFNYFPNGYHPQSRENALGHVESYTYYPENGLLKTITDEENNLTTEMEYDGFGRQVKVKYPDGNEVYTGLRWATGHQDAPENALYYAYRQASGGEPSLEFFDKYNKTLRSMGTSFDGTPVYSDTEYDSRLRVYRQSQPYAPQEEKKWTTFQYDNLNRLASKDFPDLKFTSLSYSPRVTNTTSGKGSKTQSSKQTVNGLGEVIASEDNSGNIVETKYYASGLPKEKSISGKPFAITLSYDIYGNRDTLSDPDAGVITSTYNAFSELLSQKDANGNKTGYIYDDLGRVLEEKQFAPGDILLNTKSFTYDTRFVGALSTMKQDNPDHGIEYYYDNDGFGRLVKTVETYDNQTIENKFSHDAYGRLKTHEYPSGLKVNHQYNVFGYLKNISAANKTLWECLGMNSLGQITSHKQGSYISQTGYNPYGELQSQTFANGRGMAYGFDDMGNLSFRRDTYRNLKEEFDYDNINRLKTIEYHANGIHQLYNDRHMEYDDAGGVGNISSITGTGSGFVYGENAGPHALTSVGQPEPGWKQGPQEIKYTTFNKVSSITDTLEGGRILSYEILYGMDNQRRKSIYKDSGQVVRTKHYFGDYEKINENSTVKNYHYISSPTGLCAIFVTDDQSGQSQLWHTYTDHLGSLVYMVNADNSNDYKEFSLDAWGNQRDQDDWTQGATETLFAGRGFTGHEHLEEFALIDMNGRIYDPMLGRFFSPDPYVQLPGYAGSYNRYSYCLNNPLIYTDPDGKFIFTALIPGLGVLIDAACWGAVLGGAGYTASVAFSDGGFNNWNWGSFGKSVGIGAISGVVTAGIGNAFGAVGSNGIAGEFARAYTHGFANGMISEFSGGDFMTGFAAGGLGSLGGSAFSSFGGNFAQSALGQVSFSALAGGVGAELTGGDFWRGAATGATVGLLNHARHIQQSNQQTRLQVKAVRAFLNDLGYSSERVAQDVVMQRDNFFSKYYAELRNFKHYSSSFTGGHLDSYSKTSDAYLSVSRELTIGKIFGVSITETFAAKYYPSRANSIGLVHTGPSHWLESGLEFIDGGIRSVTGYDNVLYNQHRTNALRYLRYR